MNTETENSIWMSTDFGTVVFIPEKFLLEWKGMNGNGILEDEFSSDFEGTLKEDYGLFLIGKPEKKCFMFSVFNDEFVFVKSDEKYIFLRNNGIDDDMGLLDYVTDDIKNYEIENKFFITIFDKEYLIISPELEGREVLNDKAFKVQFEEGDLFFFEKEYKNTDFGDFHIYVLTMR